MHLKLAFSIASLSTGALFILTTNAVAGNTPIAVTNLGRPTNALPAFNPVANFRHSNTVLRSRGLPEVLFIGTLAEDSSSAERWPLVKALNQFGTLTGVSATTSLTCYNRSRVAHGTDITCQYVNTSSRPPDPGPPTFDFSRMHYASKYIAFVSRDLIDRDQRVYQNLSRTELALFDKYVRIDGYANWHDSIWQTIVSATSSVLQPDHMFPLLAIGGYLSTGAHIALPGDLALVSGVHIPFSAVQQSLQRAKPVGPKATAPRYSLIGDFNAETNVITAFICRADDLKPKSVCGRRIIRKILERIR